MFIENISGSRPRGGLQRGIAVRWFLNPGYPHRATQQTSWRQSLLSSPRATLGLIARTGAEGLIGGQFLTFTARPFFSQDLARACKGVAKAIKVRRRALARVRARASRNLPRSGSGRVIGHPLPEVRTSGNEPPEPASLRSRADLPARLAGDVVLPLLGVRERSTTAQTAVDGCQRLTLRTAAITTAPRRQPTHHLGGEPDYM